MWTSWFWWVEYLKAEKCGFTLKEVPGLRHLV